jgi:hypothetical protein
MEGPWCRFRREARARGDIDTAVVDSLKALDLKRPIREADIPTTVTCGAGLSSVGPMQQPQDALLARSHAWACAAIRFEGPIPNLLVTGCRQSATETHFAAIRTC